MLRSWILVAALGCAACSRAPKILEDASVTSVTDASIAQERRVLEGVPWQTDLFEEGSDGGTTKTKVGVVSIPLGATEPRPVVVALHGFNDRPEWECGSWRGVTNAYPILVCPRGAGNEQTLGWRSPEDTQQRVERAIAAARKLLPGWVRDDASIVLVGFSMGAVQAALLAQKDPARYRRVVLAESSYNPDSAMKFGAPWALRGGERVVLLCTTRGCEAPYRAAATNIARRGGHARVNIAGTNEHGVFDTVVRSMRRDWPWLVEGAPGWETYRPFVEEAALPGKTETFETK